jgi:hypothetical protein
MAKTMQVELPSGKKIFFGADGGGLQKVSALPNISNVAADRFEEAMGTLGELVGVLEKQVGALASRPSKVEIEFSASLSGDCNLWIVSGKGEAEFKVTLSWDATKPNPPEA